MKVLLQCSISIKLLLMLQRCFVRLTYMLFFGLLVKYLHLPCLNAKMLIAREEYFATKDIRDAFCISDFLWQRQNTERPHTSIQTINYFSQNNLHVWQLLSATGVKPVLNHCFNSLGLNRKKIPLLWNVFHLQSYRMSLL